jgi:ATP-binding cassette subfamily B multidrug efflux pump
LSVETTAKPAWLPSELDWLCSQIRPLLGWHVASFLCMAGGSLLALLNPFILRWMIDEVIPKREPAVLVGAAGLIFLGYEGRMALNAVGNYLLLTAAQRLGLNLRARLLHHLDALSAEYFEQTPLGTVIYPLKEPIEEISYFGSDLLPAILRTLLAGGFTLSTMLILSPALTLAVIPLIPAFVVIRLGFRQRLAADSEQVQAARLAWSNFLEEHLSSVTTIQLMGQERRQERKAFRLLARSARSNQQLLARSAWFSVCTSLSVVVSMSVVIGYGGLKVLQGSLSVGSLVAFYSFVAQLFEPISGAAELYARTQKTFASIRQVQGAFALKPQIVDIAAASPFCPGNSGLIQFVEVKFGYRRQKDMLRISALSIAPAEKIALIGDNGAGKSTLTKLIARLYEVDSGSVSIAGRDIQSISLKTLRRFVCYLPRDPVLFQGTLASNLRFARPSATDSELGDVVQYVGLASFVSTLNDGLHQQVGPGACQVSGGQRQRLAIARALLRHPAILILDEATSCLDSASEEVLLRTIQEILPGSTLIVVSHRRSTISSLQRILRLSAGRIIEDRSITPLSSFLVAGGKI